jgi:hypothetical protein
LKSTPPGKKSSKKIVLYIAFGAVFLLVIAILYLFILKVPQSSQLLIEELTNAYIFHDGQTINMDGSADECFWLREGFGQPVALAGATDGWGRPTSSKFSIAFERWQVRGITLELGIDVSPICRKVTLILNGKKSTEQELTAGHQVFFLTLPDENLVSGENVAELLLEGDGDCTATVDYVRFHLGEAGLGGSPEVDQRIIGGVKTDVLGSASTCEMNFYLKTGQKSRLELALGHDRDEQQGVPGKLRIWYQGEETGGRLLWEGDFPAHQQKKLELDLGNNADEIILLSFYLATKPDGIDWLYLANPRLVFNKIPEEKKPAVPPLVMDRSKPRTIVLIFEDALRRDMLPAYGNSMVKAPNIKEIAATGVVFENCYSPSNWTLPSFSSIFTSLPFTRTGVVKKDSMMVDNIPTMAGIFNQNGWETSIFTSNPMTGTTMGLSRGYKTIVDMNDYVKHPPPVLGEEYLPLLEEYLTGISRQKDVFITLHLMDTHEPYSIQRDSKNYYFGIYDQIKRKMPWLSQSTADLPPVFIKGRILSIYSSVSYFDTLLQQLASLVYKFRAPENTVFVLLSDHGEEVGDHGSFGHGRTLYEEMIHIPMIVWGDGVKAGRSEGFTNSIDLMPTLLQISGIDIPEGLEGRSFANQLNGDLIWEQRPIFSAMQNDIISLKCIVLDPWKLIYNGNTPELYNIAEDQKENHNKINSEKLAYGYMRGILWQWWREIHASGINENKQQLDLSPQDIEILKGLGYTQK